ALLADDGLGQLAGDAAIALVEPLDCREVALDARETGRTHLLGDGQGVEDIGRGVAGEPGPAAAQPPAADGDLHAQAALAALHHDDLIARFSHAPGSLLQEGGSLTASSSYSEAGTRSRSILRQRAA